MTCKQLGGPCDVEFSGETLDEIITNGTAHVMEMADQDEEHGKAKQMMEDAQKDPKLAEEWFKGVKATFDAQ